MRINISISKEDLKLIDQYCYATGMKRSAFLTRSALKVVEGYDENAAYHVDKGRWVPVKPKK